MKQTIVILGTGNMAKGIGTRILAGGNDVVLIGSDHEKAQTAAGEIKHAANHGASVTATTSDEVIDTAGIIILAKPYTYNLADAKKFAPRLGGKIVIEISNPMNAQYNGLVTEPGTSAAETIRALLPESAKVVKAFNTTFAGTLREGKVAGQPLDVFLAGDDTEAKKLVSELITAGGLRAIDVGQLDRAQQLEGIGLLGITLQGTLGTNFTSTWKILS